MSIRAALLLLVACGSAEKPAARQPSPPPAAAPVARAGITLLDRAPPDALELSVDAVRWHCTITIADGVQDDDLRVPIGRAIKLVLTTLDRVDGIEVSLVGTSAKRAAHFGKTEVIAFRIDQAGTYNWICPTLQPPTPDPRGRELPLYAETPEAYAAYVAKKREEINPTTREGKLALGQKVYEHKGCNSCHTIDGSPRVGVSLARLWGTRVKLSDGSTRVVDAAFIEGALKTPQAYTREGYPPSMPSYDGQLKPHELKALVVFIELLANRQ